MPGRADMGAEATGGTEAMGGTEADGLVLASGSGHIGGRIGGDTGDPMPTPTATRPSSPCHPPKSMCSLLHQHLGITATMHRGITLMSSSAPADGERWLQCHNSQHAAL
jgi:hypothetical protein